jgi:hypothetical protein
VLVTDYRGTSPMWTLYRLLLGIKSLQSWPITVCRWLSILAQESMYSAMTMFSSVHQSLSSNGGLLGLLK